MNLLGLRSLYPCVFVWKGWKGSSSKIVMMLMRWDYALGRFVEAGILLFDLLVDSTHSLSHAHTHTHTHTHTLGCTTFNDKSYKLKGEERTRKGP